jgi:hypothetical protein
MDENKILFGNHIVGIFLEYLWEKYIPGIYQKKTFWGFQMGMSAEM